MRQGGEDEDVRKSARTLLQCTIHWDEQSTTHTRELIRVIIRDPLLLLSLNLDSTHTQSEAKCLPSCGGKTCTAGSDQSQWSGPFSNTPLCSAYVRTHKFGALSASTPFSKPSPSRQANETHCHLRREEGRDNIARIITVIVIIVRI